MSGRADPQLQTLATRVAEDAGRRRAAQIGMLEEITALDAPSGDREALERPATLLGSWLASLGAAIVSHATDAGAVLEGRLGPTLGPEVLVLCHYDTVWPRGTATARPFQIAGRTATGPGVLDMRGGIIAVLGALAILLELEALARPVRLLLTPDEETGSEASRELIAARAGAADLVLVPEPALPGGALKTSRKGWLVYRLVVHGVAAHAGLEPDRGVSAVDELLGQLARIRQLAGDDGTTVNVGLLAAPNPANVVADRAEATIDVRIVDAAAEAKAREMFAGLASRKAGAEVLVELLHSRPPMVRTPASEAAVRRARDRALMIDVELGEGFAGGVSDANLAAAAGAVVIDGLGPTGGGAHAIDEHVDLDSLAERTALIALLLMAP